MNYLQSRDSKVVLQKVQKTAKKIQPTILSSKTIEECIEDIRKVLDYELGNDEYFVMCKGADSIMVFLLIYIYIS